MRRADVRHNYEAVVSNYLLILNARTSVETRLGLQTPESVHPPIGNVWF